jgi:hypothetical protein
MDCTGAGKQQIRKGITNGPKTKLIPTLPLLKEGKDSVGSFLGGGVVVEPG